MNIHELIQNHDWDFRFSDDPRAYERGVASEDAITRQLGGLTKAEYNSISEELPIDYRKELDRLWKRARSS